MGKRATSHDALVPAAKLRRIALDRQGLLRGDSFGRGRGAVARAIEHLGYVQIDTISVVARAHHHVLQSRVSNYREAHLDRLVANGEVFEYWHHAAAYLPMRDFRFALPRMGTYRDGTARWQRSRDRRLMSKVLARIEAEGPLRARDFEDPRSGRGGWWDWKPAKRALDQLFMQGDLMITAREGFQKVYDLTERVLPDGVDTRAPTPIEMADHLVDGTIRAHGFGTLPSFSYQKPAGDLRTVIESRILDRCAAGTLMQFRLPTGVPAFTDPDIVDTRSPKASGKVRVLSPFDNALIQRARGIAIFDFDYQLECYLPRGKRRYGYFCLPILYRDRFVGRADCKAHRRHHRFEIVSVHLDQEHLDAGFPCAFADAMAGFADYNRCETVALTAVSPTKLKAPLIRALDSTGDPT